MKFKLFIILLGLITFSSCVTMSVNHEIKEDGSSDIEIILDLSGLVSVTEELPGEGGGVEDMCENFPKDLKGFTCETNDYVSTIKGSFNEYVKVEESLFKTTYTYDISNIYNILSKIDNESEKKNDFDSSELKQMKAFGLSFNYDIKFPGKVIEYDTGSLNERTNVVTIDLFDIDPNKEYLVIAEKNNSTIIYSGIGIILLILIVGLFFLLKKTKKPTEINNTNPVDNNL